MQDSSYFSPKNLLQRIFRANNAPENGFYEKCIFVDDVIVVVAVVVVVVAVVAVG